MSNFNPKYDDNKKNGKIYFSNKFVKEDGTNYRKVEAICDVGKTYTESQYEISQSSLDFEIKEKIKLYESDNGQTKYWCWLIESDDGNGTTGLHICRRTSKGNVYAEQEVTLNPYAIGVLKQFLEEIKLCDSDVSFKVQTNLDDSKKIVTKSDFIKILDSNIDSIDDYYRLIDIKKKSKAVDELEEIVKGNHGNEVSIQKFLKSNLWLFGSGYCTFVKNEKINSKNILDGIPKNLESFIDIIEVKMPEVELFRFDSDHNNYYASSNLTKAIAQTQNYIFELEKMTTDEEYQQNNNCKIIKPRGIILIGSKEELSIDEQQYLRILNSSYHNLYIMTYQQLLEKAKNMLKVSDVEKEEN